jgi:SlyX protein
MLNARLDRLEERLAWLERHVTEQDRAMLELHEVNVRLRRELAALRAATAGRDEPEDAGARAEADPRPPHY